MFGIGPTELVVILVVGLLILGPKRLPELARTLGKGFAEFRRASNELRSQIETSVEAPPTPPAAPPPPPEKPSKLPPDHPSARSPEDQLNAEGDIPLAAPAAEPSDDATETPPRTKTVTTIWDDPEPSSEEGDEDDGDAAPCSEKAKTAENTGTASAESDGATPPSDEDEVVPS